MEGTPSEEPNLRFDFPPHYRDCSQKRTFKNEKAYNQSNLPGNLKKKKKKNTNLSKGSILHKISIISKFDIK